MEWTESLKRAVSYIEEHLLEDIDVQDIATAVYLSPFYFQKGFSIMTGYSVGEYIRQRRLYLAALDALSGQHKIIDLAYKYGYQTPESFTKAFTRFHGVSPMQIRQDAAKITVFLPLKITVSIQGGMDMDFTVEQMDSITVIGWQKSVPFEGSYQTVPALWGKLHQHCNGTDEAESELRKLIDRCAIGEFGICIDDQHEAGKFVYMIAGRYDGSPVPEDMTTYTIPAGLWARFRCVGPMPGAIQAVNTKILQEWLPGNPDYELSAWVNIEWYSMGDTTSLDYESEVWMPVKRK